MLSRVSNRETKTIINALIKQARKLPDELYKSLSWDRGRARRPSPLHHGNRHRRLFLRSTEPLAARIERKHQPTLAQYFPRGTDLAPHSQAELNKVARRLNERPRKRLLPARLRRSAAQGANGAKSDRLRRSVEISITAIAAQVRVEPARPRSDRSRRFRIKRDVLPLKLWFPGTLWNQSDSNRRLPAGRLRRHHVCRAIGQRS
jgi:hypothetical protein